MVVGTAQRRHYASQSGLHNAGDGASCHHSWEASLGRDRCVNLERIFLDLLDSRVTWLWLGWTATGPLLGQGILHGIGPSGLAAWGDRSTGLLLCCAHGWYSCSRDLIAQYGM